MPFVSGLAVEWLASPGVTKLDKITSRSSKHFYNHVTFLLLDIILQVS